MSKTEKNGALVWFKNNLRVQDNTPLQSACESHDKVIGVFYFEKKLFFTAQYGFKKIEKFRAKFLIETIKELQESLSKLNITLLVYFENPETHLPKLCNELNISTLFLQKEWTAEECSTMATLEKQLSDSVMIESFYDQFLIHPDCFDYRYDSISNVFTNFRKYVEKECIVKETKKAITKRKDNLLPNTTPIPTLKTLGFEEFETHPNTAFPFSGGEKSALKRLEYYFFESRKLGFYKKTRNGLAGVDYSSKFSPWLANGSISARMIFHEVKEFEKKYYKNQSTYWLIFELLWRDYFKYISLKYGNKIFSLDGILDKKYTWKTDSSLVKQWIDGTTLEPFVNANMLELKHTGWMSNRGRQNVASYFTKSLQLDWRIGAAYFESFLLDYDVHSNYGNWMYVAGVGNDPRNREFNIRLQAERYDKNNMYQRTWLQPKLF